VWSFIKLPVSSLVIHAYNLLLWLILFRFMIYDNKTGITYESASTYSRSPVLSGCSYPPPHHHSQLRSSMERWSRNTPRMHGHCQSVLITSSIQRRRQRHLTWSPTHDAVSQEINSSKNFDLLIKPVTFGTKCKVLNRYRPPELNECNFIVHIL